MSTKKYLKSRLFFLFAIMVLFANMAEANIDSLMQIWTNVSQPDSVRFNAINEYYKEKLFHQPDSVILLTAYHMELAQEKHSEIQKAIALDKKAIAYNIKGDSDNALIEMKKAVEIYSSLKDSIKLMRVYNNLALIYYHRIEYQEALKYFSEPLTFYQINKVKDMEASVSVNIGLVHSDVGNYDLAMEYFDRSLYIYKELEVENSVEVGTLWQNISNINYRRKNYHQAIENTQQALKIYEPLNEEYFIAISYSLMARIHQELNQIDSAMFYVEKGLKIYQKIAASRRHIENKIVLASLIFHSDVNRATKIGEDILREKEESLDHSMKMELFNLLYKCYKKKRNYQLSIAMLEKQNTYADSLRIEQNQIAVTQKAIQTKYETEILNTKLKSEKSQSQLKLSQLKKTYSILFLGSLIILGIFFHFRSKRKILSKEKDILNNKINYLKELEKTRYQLIQSDKMAALGQLTAGIAHEINNPVNFISAGIIGLKRSLSEFTKSYKDYEGGGLEKDLNDMVAAIEEGASRTSKIVNSLRMFSREDTENYLKTDIIEGIESTLTLLSNKLNNDILLERDYDKTPLFIYCFPGQLNQVFMNILSNAIQAVVSEGHIKIKIKEYEKNIVISISDDGPGISDENKKKIFEPFYTTKGVKEGTGLGLSIAYGIIKNHNGLIEAKDNEPKGAKFIINLPKLDRRLINT